MLSRSHLALAAAAVAATSSLASGRALAAGPPALDRDTFNRLAVQAGAPLFWRADANGNGALDADELVVLGLGGLSQRARWVKDGRFTPAFTAVQRDLVELRRREAVRLELSQGRPTLLETDFTGASKEDRAVVRYLAEAARVIDELYLVQSGAAGLDQGIAKDDIASRALFARNSGPWCEAPQTTRDPFCNAVPGFPEQRIDGLPRDAAQDDALCARLAAEPNHDALTSPFTVVRPAPKGGGLVAKPYHEHYRPYVTRIAASLRSAAAAVESADEAPFKAYLTAAAKAFETDDWESADEAWAAMNGLNSKWYLRVAADETYFGACQLKAGYHMSFARIDPSAREWQKKLTALRSEMEGTIAATIGAPYAARDVKFQLPDFISIVINAGDSRSALGATIGQSLPNFGRVADESRGRTVVMVNLYTDPDSLAVARRQAESMLAADALGYWTDTPEAGRLDVVLHEACHNLGPQGSWKVDGKAPEEVFGGAIDAILEELKAQTGSLYFPELLRKRGLITEREQREVWVKAIVWAFGHISRGMTNASGKPQTYSQLAAIQVGELMAAGALRFDETAGGAVDTGRFVIDFARLPAAVEAMMRTVGGLKARGDRAAAEALIARHTGAEGLARLHAALITERMTRYPKAAFVYAPTY